jgi:cell division septum initiation protein DivIVA
LLANVIHTAEAKLHAEKAAAEDANNKLRKDIQKYREEIDELSEFKIQKVEAVRLSTYPQT